ATFALIAQRSDPARVGSITGFVGAAGGLGGFVPPILLGAMWSATQDYSLWLLLLAGFTAIALLITLWSGTNPPAPEAAAAGDTASRPRDTAAPRAKAAPRSHRPATTTRRHGHDHREHGTAQRRAHVCGVLGAQDRPPGHRQFAHGCAHRQPEVLHPAGRGLRRQARAPP